MSHEHSKETSNIISFKNSFWLVVIIVGLFVAALNFVQAESKLGEVKTESTEQADTKVSTEAPATKTEQKAQEPTPAATAPAADTTAKAK